MKINREMKRRAAADHKKTLEKNQEFFQSVINDNYPKHNSAVKRKNLSWQRIVCSATAVVVVILTITMMFIFIPNSEKPGVEKAYLKENIITKSESLSDLNSTLQSVNFDFSSYIIKELILYYDSVSKDKLFYRIKGTDLDELSEWIIEVGVNDKFDLPYNDTKYSLTKEVYGYTVYCDVECREEDGLYFISAKAKVILEKEMLYLNYSGVAFEENEDIFIEFMQNIIVRH